MINNGVTRIHSTKSSADLIYRLDIALLGEEEPDVNVIEFGRRRSQSYRNNNVLCEMPLDFENYLTFSKASIVLSESSKLEDTNTCFTPSTEVEQKQTFILGTDSLSEHLWAFKTEEILERFDDQAKIHCKTETFPEVSVNSRHRFSCNMIHENSAARTYVSRSTDLITTAYETNPYWSEHKHPAKPWDDDLVIGTILQI